MRYASFLWLIPLVIGLAACDEARLVPVSALPVVVTRVDELGDAFASSSINVPAFREQAIIRLDRSEYLVALYDQTGDVQVLLVRDGTVLKAMKVLPRVPEALIGDGHVAISLGLSSDGFLHVMYGAHATIPYYARVAVQSIRESQGRITVAAAPWGKTITYPQFYNVGPALELWFRADPASAVHRTIYSRALGGFSVDSELLLSPGDADRVYMNQLAVRGEERTLTWMYRLFSVDETVRNEGLYGMRSSGNGPWYALEGGGVNLPVVRGDLPPFKVLAASRQPMNQTATAVAADGTLYVTYYAKDDAGYPQIFLARVGVSGKVERTWLASSNRDGFELFGRGTLVLPISRPQLHVSENQAHVFFRQGDAVVVSTIWFDQSNDAVFRQCLMLGDLGAWEPNTSREFWGVDRQIYLLVQPVRQGPLDQLLPGPPTRARMLVMQETVSAPRRDSSQRCDAEVSVSGG